MCDICCEDLKKPISCNICNFSACYKCFSKFMLECTMNPKCMKCDKPWSRKHLVNSFGQYFVSHSYKKRRENVLFDIEKAMLPDTQPIAAQILKMKNLQRQIDIHENSIRDLRSSISRLEIGVFDSEFDEYLQSRKNYRMQIHNFQEDVQVLTSLKDRIYTRIHRSGRNAKRNTEFVVKCPGSECRGFAMGKTNGLECDLCNTVLCKECHEPLDKGTPLEKDESVHTCDQNTLETVRLLKKDSKNCPTCKSVIYKIDGCDQMFCTQCHTAFSWRTGEVNTGRIHNPHYYEYLRKTGNDTRELGDIPCGGLPRANQQIVSRRMYSKIHRIASHFEFDEIFRLRQDCNRYEGNQDLRISYLNNEICLITFKSEIYRREKALEKKREILAVLTTFVVVCSDIFRNILEDKAAFEDEVSTVQQFENIRDFTNESLMDVSRVYKCVVPVIGYNWEYGRSRA